MQTAQDFLFIVEDGVIPDVGIADGADRLIGGTDGYFPNTGAVLKVLTPAEAATLSCYPVDSESIT